MKIILILLAIVCLTQAQTFYPGDQDSVSEFDQAASLTHGSDVSSDWSSDDTLPTDWIQECTSDIHFAGGFSATNLKRTFNLKYHNNVRVSFNVWVSGDSTVSLSVDNVPEVWTQGSGDDGNCDASTQTVYNASFTLAHTDGSIDLEFLATVTAGTWGISDLKIELDHSFLHCMNKLDLLTFETVSQTCDVTYKSAASFGDNSHPNGDYEHNYVLSFNAFIWDSNCFSAKLQSGTDIDNTPIDWQDTTQTDFTINENGDNKLKFDFSWQDAASLNCHVTDEGDSLKQSCFFQVEVRLNSSNDEVQQEIQWHSLTIWPKDVKKEVSVAIIKDLVQGCCPPNEFEIDDTLIFCTTIACDVEKADKRFVRNQSIFMKYAITSVGFSDQWLGFTSLLFDDYEPQLVNEADIRDPANADNGARGQLIFEVKYSVADPTVLIKLVVNILRGSPSTNPDQGGSDDFNENGEAPVSTDDGSEINGGDQIGDSSDGDDHANGDHGDNVIVPTPGDRRRLATTTMALHDEDVPMGRMTNIEIIEEEETAQTQVPAAQTTTDDNSSIVIAVVIVGVVIALLLIGGAVFMLNRNKNSQAQGAPQQKYIESAQNTEEALQKN